MGRETSDETYVLGLCEEILGEHCLRQHCFPWLQGDLCKDGRRRLLPVDGYWPGHQLVVEYRERQHDEPVRHFDKPDYLTVSGVHRGLQRALYDARRDELIPAHGLRLVVVRLADLNATKRKLRRTPEVDVPVLRRLLAVSPA